MPFLPLPLDTSIEGDLPVSTGADVLAEFPATHKKPPEAPVRDAFAEGFAEGFIEYQNRASYASGQSDPLKATGEYLKGYAAEHEVVPDIGETEEHLRARIFASPSIVTPDAIEARINAIIAPHVCFISELDLDGWFIHSDAAAVWDSFVGADPNYPDRYYDELPNTLPGGCIPSNGLPRSFFVRIPALNAQDDVLNYIGNTFFVSNTLMNIYASIKTSTDLYNAVIAAVESIKGQGISWSLLIDPRLT